MSMKHFLFILLCLYFLCSSAMAVYDIYVCDINKYTPQVNTQERHAILSFQGAVNRTAPRLFVIYDYNELYWLEDLEDDGEINIVATYGDNEDPMNIFGVSSLQTYCDDYIVYDYTDCNLALNNACSLAGILTGTAVCDKSIVGQLQNHGLTLHTDSDANMVNKWATPEAAQLWGKNNLMGDCITTDYFIHKGSVGFNKRLDLGIAENMFFWAPDPGHQMVGDDTTQEAIYDNYGTGTLAHGWWTSITSNQEGETIAKLSEHGQSFVGGGLNDSFLTHFDGATATFDQDRAATISQNYLNGNTYIFFTFTQGHIGWVTRWDRYYMEEVSSYSNYPFGMYMTGPTVDVHPYVVEKLYDMMDTNLLFFSKGYGYSKPYYANQYNKLGAFMEDSIDVCKDADITDQMVNIAKKDISESLIEKICKLGCEHFRSVQTKCAIDGTDNATEEPNNFYGVTVLQDPIIANGEDSVNTIVNAIDTSSNSRQFFYVFLNASARVETLEDVIDKLETDHTDIKVLPPDKMIRFYRQLYPQGRLLADAYVKEGQPNNNFDDVFLRIRSSDSSNGAKSFLKFEVSGKGCPETAVLKLKLEDEDIDAITCRSVSGNSWEEDTITWNTMPSRITILDVESNLSAGDWVEFDVSDFVTGPGTYSFCLSTGQDSGGLDLISGEGNNAPELIMTPDETAPTPDPMTFSTDPYATGTSSISMTASNASDDSGVEYKFECTAGGGHDSDWQDSRTYTDTGLSAATQYTYRCRARDKSARTNLTSWSSTKSATTDSSLSTTLTDDAFCKEAAPTTNLGSSTDLRVRGGASDKKIISFLKFTVSGAGSITSAKLRIKADANMNGVTCRSVTDNSWSESTITYNNMPSRVSALDQISSISSGNWYEFDVSSFVTSTGTYSLALSTSEDSAGLDWLSKESASDPQLLLNQ